MRTSVGAVGRRSASIGGATDDVITVDWGGGGGGESGRAAALASLGVVDITALGSRPAAVCNMTSHQAT